jgi:hypothetical protein
MSRSLCDFLVMACSPSRSSTVRPRPRPCRPRHAANRSRPHRAPSGNPRRDNVIPGLRLGRIFPDFDHVVPPRIDLPQKPPSGPLAAFPRSGGRREGLGLRAGFCGPSRPFGAILLMDNIPVRFARRPLEGGPARFFLELPPPAYCGWASSEVWPAAAPGCRAGS